MTTAPQMEFTASRRGLLVPVDALSADTKPVRVGEVPAAAGVVQEPTGINREPARADRDLVVTAPAGGQVDGGQRRQRAQVSAAVLRAELAARRDVTGVQRDDTVERRRQEVDHRGDLADIKADERAAARQRREDERDGVEAAKLAELYRRATRAGERARIRAGIQRSAEMRALRVAAVQRGTLAVGLPVLAGFAAWSTTGVQAGMARLLHLEPGTPGWWAAWIVEPLLIAIVAGIIIVRAGLRSSGGDTDRRADRAEGCALAVSIALNLLGGWTGTGGVFDMAGEALGHSIGALGAAGTAWLIGVIIDYTTRAKPWDGAERLAEMNLLPPSDKNRPEGVRTAIKRGKHAPDDTEMDGLPDDVRKLLHDTREAIADGALSPDPSGYAIYKHVMGGKGDRARSVQAAHLAAGWRPALRAVDGGQGVTR